MQRTYDGAVYLHGTGRNVKTLTDARGFVTTNEYDSKERLLTGVTDAKGNKVTYTYDTKNDLLTGATASDGTNTVKLGYTYDEGDRLKNDCPQWIRVYL